MQLNLEVPVQCNSDTGRRTVTRVLAVPITRDRQPADWPTAAAQLSVDDAMFLRVK